MQELYAHTSTYFYNKYEEMAKKYGISYKNAQNIFGYSKDEVIEKFKEDENLNNIPLKNWDILAANMFFLSGKGYSLAEKVCVLKFCVIYQMIGAIPIFKKDSE